MRTIEWVVIIPALVAAQHGAGAETRPTAPQYVIGATAGYTVLSFPAKLDQDLGFVAASVIAGATWNGWQLSLNGAFSLEDGDISEEEDVGEGSRVDIDLTLGYQINRNWSVFGGYKRGETEIDFVSRESEDEAVVDVVKESYEQEGPYVGASFSWDFATAGRLTLAIAYADLSATNDFGANTDDDEDEDDEALEFDDITGRVKGDTTGLSYGVTWTMPIAPRLLFQARLKVNDYQQDVRFEDQRFKNIDETLSTLQIGLAYVF